MIVRSVTTFGLAFALLGLGGLGVWVGCSGEGRPICRCASDCGEHHICLDASGKTVTTCLDPSAAAGACVPAGTSNDDAGSEAPEIEPELYDLLWSKRNLADVEPSTDDTATTTSDDASDSVTSSTSLATSSSMEASSGSADSSGNSSGSSESDASTTTSDISASAGSSGDLTSLHAGALE